MGFTTLSFLCLALPAVLLVSLLLRGRRIYPAFLALLGLLFLLAAGWQGALFFTLFIILNAAIAKLPKGARKPLALVINLLAIALVKLLPFIAQPELARWLPLGLSYAALQALGYHLDEGQPDFPGLAFHLLFLPKLPMGPVTAYPALKEQVPKSGEALDGLAAGLGRLILGLGKKLLLADRLAQMSQAALHAAPDDAGLMLAVLGALVFPLQLYLDFSGYTDIALGFAQALGYRLPGNFRQPFRADSVRDFWRRWHQSLTAWLGRHVYIPLGGSRRGQGRTLLNTGIVFLLIALWHGLGWGFLLWGAWNALLISLERLGLLRPEGWGRLGRRAYVYLAAAVGFAFFALPGTGLEGLLAFTRAGNPRLALFLLDPEGLLALAAGILVVALEGRGLAACFPRLARQGALLAILALALLAAAGRQHLPFIYAGY